MMTLQVLMDSVLGTALCLVVALACAFMGCRLQKPLIALTVLYTGFMLFYHLGGRFLPYPEAVMGFAMVAAVIAAALSCHLYIAGIFATMMIIGVSIGHMWISNQWIALLAGVAVGCVLGALAICLNRPIVIFVTGVMGGFAAAKYGADLLMKLFVMNSPTKAMLMVSGTILATAGLAVQIRSMQEVTSRI